MFQPKLTRPGATIHARTKPNANTFGRDVIFIYILTVFRNLSSCREGLDKPPPWTKKRIEIMMSTDTLQSKVTSDPLSPSHNKSSVYKIQPSDVVNRHAKRTLAKSDQRMQQLETLHERMNVQGNLKISEGRRIKLDNQGSSKEGEKKVSPDFDFSFVRMDDGISTDCGLAQLDDSDNELPEPCEILDTGDSSAQSESLSATMHHQPNRYGSYVNTTLHLSTVQKELDTLSDSTVLESSQRPSGGSFKRKRDVDNIASSQRKVRISEEYTSSPMRLQKVRS